MTKKVVVPKVLSEDEYNDELIAKALTMTDSEKERAILEQQIREEYLKNIKDPSKRGIINPKVKKASSILKSLGPIAAGISALSSDDATAFIPFLGDSETIYEHSDKPDRNIIPGESTLGAITDPKKQEEVRRFMKIRDLMGSDKNLIDTRPTKQHVVVPSLEAEPTIPVLDEKESLTDKQEKLKNLMKMIKEK